MKPKIIGNKSPELKNISKPFAKNKLNQSQPDKSQQIAVSTGRNKTGSPGPKLSTTDINEKSLIRPIQINGGKAVEIQLSKTNRLSQSRKIPESETDDSNLKRSVNSLPQIFGSNLVKGPVLNPVDIQFTKNQLVESGVFPNEIGNSFCAEEQLNEGRDRKNSFQSNGSINKNNKQNNRSTDLQRHVDDGHDKILNSRVSASNFMSETPIMENYGHVDHESPKKNQTSIQSNENTGFLFVNMIQKSLFESGIVDINLRHSQTDHGENDNIGGLDQDRSTNTSIDQKSPDKTRRMSNARQIADKIIQLPLKNDGNWSHNYKDLDKQKISIKGKTDQRRNSDALQQISTEVSKDAQSLLQSSSNFSAKKSIGDSTFSPTTSRVMSPERSSSGIMIERHSMSRIRRKSVTPVHSKTTIDQLKRAALEDERLSLSGFKNSESLPLITIKPVLNPLTDSNVLTSYGSKPSIQIKKQFPTNSRMVKINQVSTSTKSPVTKKQDFGKPDAKISVPFLPDMRGPKIIQPHPESKDKKKSPEKTSTQAPVMAKTPVVPRNGIPKEIPSIQSPLLFINWLQTECRKIPNVQKANVNLKIGETIFGVGSNTHRGTTRNYNEDEVEITIVPRPNTHPNLKKFIDGLHTFGIFSIFDGHGGPECSKFMKKSLHDRLIDEAFHYKTEFNKQVRQTYIKTELAYMKTSIEQNLPFSGTCSVTLAVVNNLLITINVGDSRCILSKNGGREVIALTKDHKPEEESEFERITKAGGKVYRTTYHFVTRKFFDEVARKYTDIKYFEDASKANKDLETGPWRVSPGSLSVSRTIGDFVSKYEKLGGLKGAVVNEPEINETEIERADFAIIGCELKRRRSI